MQDWILFLTLIIIALSLAAVGIVCRCCRNTEREKDRRLAHAVREQDRYARELEHLRIEKQTLERVLETKSAASDQTDATAKTNDNS